MTDDEYRRGYEAARSYYLARTQAGTAAGAEWSTPARQDVAALVRKHWPDLAERLDALGGSDARP